MYTGTTPTIIFSFDDFDPSTAESVILTFFVGSRSILELDEDDLEIDSSTVEATLTQAQTLSFPLGSIQVQLNFLLDDGVRAATEIKTINVLRNLHSSAMS